MWLQTAIVYALIMFIIPVIFTKPTGIQFIDDIIMYTNANKQYVLQSTILVALSGWAAERYISSTQ